MLSRLLVLVRLALANIASSLLNFFVGAVLALGAAVLVIVGSLYMTLDQSLSKSVVGSITGHLQVYGARSKDPLEVYGKMDGSDSDLTPLESFPALKARLLKIPNVKRVVPMGAATAMVMSGTTVDLALERLRNLYRTQGEAGTRVEPAEFERRVATLATVKGHVRNMLVVMSKGSERANDLVAADAIDPTNRANLERAMSDAFWADFDADPLGHLEFLENKVAPLVDDNDMTFIRYLGTDLDAYQRTFDRMAIVEGEAVPPGHRGILLPRFFYEEYLKLKSARRLDKIKEARSTGRRLANEDEKDLRRMVRENHSQTTELALQLDALKTSAAVEKLQKLLGTTETDLPTLLGRFFDMTDENFDQRYRFFYDELAPDLALYRVKVGDTIVLRSVGRSGSMNTAEVKVYGVFEFRGLEKSPLAGANALLDMVTFRDLYGFLTPEAKAEQEALKRSANVREVSRENAEDQLFGGDGPSEEEVKARPVADPALSTNSRGARSDTFPIEEIDDGVVLNAAVILEDGSPIAVHRTQAAIETSQVGS